MRKTMIYLPETDYFALRLLAERKSISMAKLVRESVKKELARNKLPSGASFLKKLASYKVKEGKELASKVDTIYK